MISKELFQLIKSLSQSEKGYFKRHVGKRIDTKKSIAIKIFDALALQKEFDNKALLKKLQLKNKAHLPMYKRMLQNMIIRVLSLYHSDITPQAQIRHLLDSFEILFNKEQYSLCRKTIIKAKYLANKYEAFMYLTEILQYEIKIETVFGRNNSALILNAHKEQELILGKQKNVLEYSKLKEELYSFAKKNQVARTPDERMIIKKIMENTLLQSEEKAMSQYAKVIYFFCNGASAFIEGNDKKANYYIVKQLELLNNNPQLIELNPTGYIGALTNFVLTTFQVGKYEEVEVQVKKASDIINLLPEKLKHNLDSPILNLQNILLKMYIDTGQFEKGNVIATNIEQSMNTEDKARIDALQSIPILFNIAYLNFGLLNYKKALLYTNLLLNKKNNEIRIDIQLFARILNIIIYFEMNEQDVIPYLTKSLYRQLIQKKKLYKAEGLIVNWIRIKLPKIKNNNDLIKSFVELKEKMEQLVSDPLEARALEYFDFISWLKSKIEKRPFADCVRQRAISLAKG